MPSFVTHVFSGAALGAAYSRERMPVRFWILAALCSVLPDIDSLAFYYGIRSGEVFGHRGFTHSLLFALLLGVVVVVLAFRDAPLFSKKWWELAAFFFAITASHGMLDAMTDKGYGVGFFVPFDNTRYFLPWRLIPASPMRISKFLSYAGVEVVLGEMLWIWLPLIAFTIAVRLSRKKSGISP